MAASKYHGRSAKASLINPILSIALIALIVVGGYYSGKALGWWGAAPVVETPAPDAYEFLVLDYESGEEVDEDDHEIYIYTVDISALDTEEIDDLEFTDYALDDELNSGDDFDNDEDLLVWAIINGSDYCEYQIAPILGLNTIYLLNLTEDVSIAAFSIGGVTCNLTDYRDWTINIMSLDASEGTTAEVTTEEGYMAFYDLETADYNSVVIRLTLNTTAALSYGEEKSDYEATEKASGDYLYYEFTGMTFTGMESIDIRLGSGLGTDFELDSIAIGYGSADDFTAWDTQA